MAHRLLTVETLPLTRELADQFATSPTFVGERELEDSRLKLIAQWLNEHVWTCAQWATCKVLATDEVYRVNGHHSSLSLNNCADDVFPTDSPVIIQHYEADTLDDLANVFDLFDNPVSARSSGDKFNFFFRQYPTLAPYSVDLIGKIMHGVASHYTEVVREAKREKKPTTDAKFSARERGRYLALPLVQQFLVWAQAFAAIKLGKRLLAVSEVTQAMYADYNRQPELAEVFWGQVMTASNDDPDHPTRELNLQLERLLARKQESTAAAMRGKFGAACAKAFRQFRKYDRTTNHRSAQAVLPATEQPAAAAI